MIKLKAEYKVFVAMSGGVDSAVSAALLKEAGYDVTGVFMKVWSPDWLPCPWPEERRDAMRVAAHLQIPFFTFDFSAEYKQRVVDYMIDEYRRGRVPNPDVMCNKFVKFDAFLKKTLEKGADAIATGHYARIQGTGYRAQGTVVRENSDRPTPYALLAGADKNKDQSYFLWTLTQAQLVKIVFPVGDLTKPQVRKEARRFGLPVAEKKDSQGVCFLGPVDMKQFLKHYIKEMPGEVVNENGEAIGHHEGVTFYTIGERRGFTITKKTPTDGPYYVVAKNIESNQLIVAHRNTEIQPRLISVMIEQVNWIKGEGPDLDKTYQARIRYRQPLQECRISNLEFRISVQFEKPQEAVAPGQSLVLYDGEECLGGGIVS